MWPLPARDGVCWGWGWIAGKPARDAKILTYCCCPPYCALGRTLAATRIVDEGLG